MSEKKVKKSRKSEDEIKNRIEAEKFIYEKAKKAEEIEEKKEDEVKPGEKLIKKESKTLRNIFLVLVLIVAVVAFILILNNASRSFTVDGVKYNIVQTNGTVGSQLIFYNTKVPVIYQGKLADYNFYLYSDPRIIQKQVPFNGNIDIIPSQTVVLNMTENFNCNGDGIVAITNLDTLYNLIGKIISDPNATCDPAGRYVFINIQNSSETSIQETAPECYTINVNNCQILPAVERYMTKIFATLHNMSQ